MAHNTWQTCLKHLERELPAEDFNTWIRPLQIKSKKGRSILLSPNEYVRDYIALNYLERIRDIFEHMDETRDSVVVEVNNKQEVHLEPRSKITTPIATGLDKRYRFNNFVQGKSNELLIAAHSLL